MKKSLLLIIVSLLSYSAYAEQVDNSKMVNLYHSQLAPTKQLMSETNEVMKLSTAAYSMFKKTQSLSPEAQALSSHLIDLASRSQQLYGDINHETPFSSCRQVPSLGYDLWLTRLSNIKNPNEKQLEQSLDIYNVKVKECSKEIKSPPPKRKEALTIIDVTE